MTIVWMVKGFLFLVLLFVLVYFFLANSGEQVDVNVFGREYQQVGLYWVIVLSFLIGFAVCFVMASWRELRLHARIRRLKGRLQEKDREVVQLRALPLQDFPAGEEPSEEREGE